MNIEVTINNVSTPDEKHDALLATVEAANVLIRAENARRAALTPPEAASPEYTAASYLKMLLDKAVDSYAKQRYDAALKRLGEAAATLPYADRLALIANVEATVGN